LFLLRKQRISFLPVFKLFRKTFETCPIAKDLSWVEPLPSDCPSAKRGYAGTRAEGRLSSDSPNLQNFPKHDNAFIREMFAVPENHVLMSFDYKGAELRVLAMESKDRELIKQINNGYDMHIEWAGRLEQAINREVSKHEGKNSFVFPTVYGSSYKSIAKNMGVDEALIEKVQREFFKMFPSCPVATTTICPISAPIRSL